jgi:hypothetical protein
MDGRWGGGGWPGGGEGETKTQRRRRSNETGVGGGTVRNGRDNGQRADTKPKNIIKIVCIRLPTVPG